MSPDHVVDAPSSAAGAGPGSSRLAVEFRDVGKRYGATVAVEGVSLGVRDGEFLTLLGPSGSGKTTLLKLLAGFEVPTTGQIMLGDRDVSTLRPGDRNIGMVFQHYALFPHMSVLQNVEYGLKMRGIPRAERRLRASEAMKLVRLQGFEERRPQQLSGGQQQRVALARAVAFGPSVLLMDEPLGALDRALRLEVAQELRRIHRELGTTIVYVTHDQEEALALSERIAILRSSRLVASGTPQDLYSRPASSFVATFFAAHNLLPVEDVHPKGSMSAEVLLGTQRHVLPAGGPVASGADVRVAIRPQRMRLIRCEHGEGCLRFEAFVQETIYAGEATQLICTVDGCPRLVATTPVPEHLKIGPGSIVDLFVCREDAVVVTYDGEV